jgi:hypothetical protein
MTIMGQLPTVTAIGVAILLGMPLARTASAETFTPPEAVAHLLFSSFTTAMPKTVTPGRVTYRGADFPGDPDRRILSISASRAAPCLFEAFFFDVMLPSAGVSGWTASYHATIDLRRLDRATFTAAPQPGGGAQLVLAAKDMLCARSAMLEQTKLDHDERCRDTIEDAIVAEHTPRLRAAFDVLRLACRW